MTWRATLSTMATTSIVSMFLFISSLGTREELGQTDFSRRVNIDSPQYMCHVEISTSYIMIQDVPVVGPTVFF